MTMAFARAATVTATTKRATLSGGTSTGYVTHLSGVKCLPLMSVDPETRNRPELQTFHEVKETFVDGGLDIMEGDKLVIGSVEYPIRAVDEQPWLFGGSYLRLLVEELKR